MITLNVIIKTNDTTGVCIEMTEDAAQASHLEYQISATLHIAIRTAMEFLCEKNGNGSIITKQVIEDAVKNKLHNN